MYLRCSSTWSAADRTPTNLVFTLDDGGQWPEIAISSDGRYLIVSMSRGLGAGDELRVLELARPERGWQLLIPEGKHRYAVVGAKDGTFYLLTDDAADRCRIVAVDVANPGRDDCREVVPEADDTLMEAHFFGGRLVCHYLRDACSLLRVYRLDGVQERDITVPAMSTLSGRLDKHDAIEGTADSGIVHFQVESYTAGPSLWRHDLATSETSMVCPSPFSLGSGYLTERVFVEGADGTRVPLFLTRRRDLTPDGTARVLLYGYGGAGIAITPHFSPTWAAWVEQGGMLAVASLRGGGEYGRSWYEAGRLARKQQAFDDFSACARWLAKSGWSSAERIAISGGSSGGLLVGACLTRTLNCSGPRSPASASSTCSDSTSSPADGRGKPSTATQRILASSPGCAATRRCITFVRRATPRPSDHRRARQPRRAWSFAEVRRNAAGGADRPRPDPATRRRRGRSRSRQADRQGDRRGCRLPGVHRRGAAR